ncbi:MAG: DNA/RNA endonuclease [Crocinitomicaceae bacterium]|nr:DNA/RNA endonuclease [Crocinitomicaceae bacterium]MAW84265.1 DNA/RNA endonuclease [Crocinitomicaceae bacterium]|tara:strand:+ start:3365 stop:4114 length:750 start_codon:yes stop_codon:yes gene_type:complete
MNYRCVTTFTILLIIPFLGFSQDLYPLGFYNNVINHNFYTLSYSKKHKLAEWVFYDLQSAQLIDSLKRKNNFKKDPLIKESSASLSDYKASGFDRGHLAPAADMKYSVSAIAESFYLSNMSPQVPGFNRGIWRKIEKKIRDWAYKYGELIIVTGPILNGTKYDVLGENKVTIPQWFYKVAIDPNNYNRNIAILIENKSSSESISNFIISIDSLESFSGLDFFHNLPNEIENSIEKTTHIELWDWKYKIK